MKQTEMDQKIEGYKFKSQDHLDLFSAIRNDNVTYLENMNQRQNLLKTTLFEVNTIEQNNDNVKKKCCVMNGAYKPDSVWTLAAVYNSREIMKKLQQIGINLKKMKFSKLKG